MTAYNPPTAKQPAAAPRHWFYVGAALLLLALMFTGFLPFYLHGQAYHGQPLPPPIRGLLIAHGIGMTAWTLLFLIQSGLMAAGRPRLHRRLGPWVAVLAGGLVLLGLWLGIEAARTSPPDLRIGGLLPRQFLVVPVFNILAFGLLVGLGVWQRRRPEVHRPLMLLGTTASMSAAISRIDAISSLYQGTVWADWFGPFFGMLGVGGLLLVAKWGLTGRFDRWFALAYAALVVGCAGAIWLATTAAWANWADLLLG